ncbi:MAG: hypothetical protein DRP97_02835 [Candidatus Latescibacterota bacterium]|nr:MAG: hypothetical protein DRP97_02835 [Candidatus Latescibacterota bacterium]
MAEFIDYDKLNGAIGLGNNGATINTNNLGTILGSLLPYLLTIAGLILFFMLISGGFTMLSGAANQESQEKGKKMITSSLTGFFLIFLAYWIAQILQVIFQIDIVG